MNAATAGRQKRTYHLRPWGRPIGVTAGSLIAALTFGPLDAFLTRGSRISDELGFGSVFNSSFIYLAENWMYLIAQFALVWWWLSFVKYRSRTAFALTGLALATYPVVLIIGRNLAFGPMQSVDVLLIVGAIIAAHALAGAASMLGLHFAAFRREV